MTEDDAPRSGPSAGPRPPWVVAALGLLAGVCAQTSGTIWSRLLAGAVGTTAIARAGIVLSLLVGIGVGAWVSGRIVDRSGRPLRMLAKLESALAAYALVVPWLVAALGTLRLPSTIAWLAVSLPILGPPSFLIGGTLPALARAAENDDHAVGSAMGRLVFATGVGAAVSCLLASFVWIPRLGMIGTALLTAGGSLSVAAVAWWLDRASEAAPVQDAERPPAGGNPLFGAASAVNALAVGATAVVFGVAWFRLLAFACGSTVRAEASLLGVVWAGVALGAVLFGRAADAPASPFRLLAMTQVAFAVFASCASLSAHVLPKASIPLLRFMGGGASGMTGTVLMLALATALPASLVLGGVLPSCARLAADRGVARMGSWIGTVCAWCALGAAAGTVATGLLLPTIGAERTVQIVTGIWILLALGSFAATPGPVRRRLGTLLGLGLLATVALAALEPRWDLGLPATATVDPAARADTRRVVLSRTDGSAATTLTLRGPADTVIAVDGRIVASDRFEDLFARRLLGHLPLALHSGPIGSACIVGLGAGTAAGAVALYRPDRMIVVALEPGIVEASRLFADVSPGVVARPGLDLRVDDGRAFLARAAERFDVIVTDPPPPALPGAGFLCGKEYFEICAERLAPGGLAAQLVPLRGLRPGEVASIVGSFVDVFARVRAFVVGSSVVLLGTRESFPPVDIAAIEGRLALPGVRESLAKIGVRGPVELLSFFELDETELARLARGAPRNGDLRPRAEFLAPLGLVTETLAPNLVAIQTLRPSSEERARRLSLSGDYAESFEALSAACEAAFAAQILLARGDAASALAVGGPAAESGHRYARHVLAGDLQKEGRELQAAGRFAEARARFVLAARYESDDLDILLDLGYADLLASRLGDAEASLERAATSYPGSAAAQYLLGFLRANQGRAAIAEALYRRAIAIEPSLSEPHVLYGHLLLAAGRPAAALVELTQGMRLGGATEGAILDRGEALLQLGRGDEALESARTAVRSFPDAPEAFDLLARAADGQARRGEAAAARTRRAELSRAATSAESDRTPAP